MNKKNLAVLLVLTLLVSLFSANTVVYGEQQYLVNANFESGVDGFGQRGDGKGEQSSNFAHEGTSSLRVYDRGDFWHGAQIDVLTDIIGDVEYTSSMWVYHEEGSDQLVKLSLQYTNGSGQNWVQFAEGTIPSGVWTNISGTLTVPANGAFTEAVVYVEAGTLGFDFYIDEVAIAYDDATIPPVGGGVVIPPVSVGRTGYIENAGFEVDEEGWSGRGDATAATSVDQASEGLQALSITGRAAGWHGAQKNYVGSFELDTEYTISFMVYHESGINEDIKMSFENTLGGNKAYEYVVGASIPSDTWTQVTGTFTKANSGDLTEALTEAILYFEAATVDLDFYVDDVQVSYELPSWDGMTTSFEEGLDGFAPRIGNEVVELSIEQARTGLQSAKVSGRVESYDGINFEYSELAETGKDYEYSLWVYQDSGSDKNIMMSIQKELATASYENIGGGTVPSGEWTQLSGEYSLNYNGELKHFSLYLESPDAALDFYVDDVSISTKVGTVVEIQDIPSIYERFANDFTVGVAIPSGTISTEAETELVQKHFNSITAENDMKPENILDSVNRGEVNNYNNDVYYDYAVEKGLLLRGHTLVWHSQTPDWFFKENFEDDGALVTREVMLARMDKYIEDVATNYSADVLYAWDVVNEAIDTGESDNMRNSLWKQVVGADFVEKAFEYTRKHTEGMDVKLFYNDYNVNDSAKRAAIYDLVTDLYDKGLIDGVGLQSHLSLNSPSVDRVEETIQLFGDYGLEVQITELDIDIYTAASSSYDVIPEELLVNQGYRYKELFEMFKSNSDVITNVTLWGLTDNRSWLNSFPVVRNNWPLIFDEDLQAKLAYYGIMDPDQLPVFSQEVTANMGTAVIDGSEAFGFTTQNPTLLTATDNTPEVKLKTLWSEGSLYAQLEVMDVSLDDSDQVSVMLDLDRNQSDEVEENDMIIQIPRLGEVSVDEGVLVNVVEVEGGYVVQLSVPLASDLVVGDKLGFDFGVTNGEHSIKWNDQYDNSSISPSRFGTLILGNELKSATALVGTATIDGIEDDVWALANEINVDNYSLNTVGSTAIVKILWDSGFLYVLAKVTDDMLSKVNGNVWEQDSVEIFIDENNNRTSSYELDDVQYRVNFDNEVSNSGGPSDSTFISATTLTDDGYIVEAKIPFNLGEEEAGMILGFDVQVNNDDGSGLRSSITNWNDLSGIGWKNTENFGLLILSDEVAEVEDNSGNTGGSSGSNSGSGSSSNNTPVDLGDDETPEAIKVSFKDVLDTHWAAKAIGILASKGIIAGNGNGDFLPDDQVTRAEFTKLVVLGFELLSDDAIEEFNDVDSDDWFYSYVASAYEAGIVKGDDGAFNPNDSITKQDMAAILYRVLEVKYTFDDTVEITLKDIDEVSAYALEAVTKLHQAGVIKGDNNQMFNPKSNCMRSEAAQLVYSGMELIEE